jgi:acyl carrier protein
MMTPANKLFLTEVIAEHFGVDTVYESAHLIDDLKGDALDVVELVMTLEEKFNVTIRDEAVDRMTTVGDIFQILDDCIAAEMR